ncbi:MAG: type II secretion system F family protein [Candidatus Zapsychrus exili]|nr:type II secretion system F family protein [Candidatus Zapsychrus exili]
MTTFIYKAKKGTIKTVTGTISANTQDEAIELINELGLLPIFVKSQSSKDLSIDLNKIKKIKRKELYIFNKQLRNLLKSGVSILKALSIIEDQTENITFRRIIVAIGLGIRNGKSFSECLMVYPSLFSQLYITMVTVGEESNNLEEVIEKISEYQYQQQQITAKVKSALAYPLFMFFMGLVSVYFILTFVLPRMAGLFESIADTLPLPTIILLKISYLFNQYAIVIILAILLIVFGIIRWAKSQKGHLAISNILLRIPIFGEIVLRNELACFCRTVVLLLNSGISIVNAIRISIPIMSNEVIKLSFVKCKDDLIAGGSFGDGIRKCEQIPVMMGHLISVGEESGNLNSVLNDIADSYEQETEEKIKVITTLLEPIMILAIGLIVGFIVFAMLLPIFQIDVLAR